MNENREAGSHTAAESQFSKTKINYTKEEKRIFKQLIAREKKIIGLKKIDGRSLAEKEAAWQRIQQAYNSNQICTNRSIKQLKKLWDNLKTEYRKTIAKQKQAALGTEDGITETMTIEDPTMEIMMDAVDVELRNGDDSDFIVLTDYNTSALPNHESVHVKSALPASSISAATPALSTASAIPVTSVFVNDQLHSYASHPSSSTLQDIHIDVSEAEADYSDAENNLMEGIFSTYSDTSSPTLSAHHAKGRSRKRTVYEEMCSLKMQQMTEIFNRKQKYMDAEHEKKMMCLDSKIKAARTKERYYESKMNKGDHGPVISMNFKCY